ncbi:MAG: right-handed parallel beta-helix repeat-containing protein [Candidatus Heimdallarchaeota archaeon]|nr:MAG: right-handed parallel beta-helix repeat-containing protein [Candidatus Heimdallarchaeota archaeon]
MNFDKSFCIFIGFLLVFGMIPYLSSYELLSTPEELFSNKIPTRPRIPSPKITSTQMYVESGPIFIDSDVLLNATFPGRGTIDDPIRIENYNITDPSDTLVGLIDIRSTTYYFRIANCLINGLGTIGNGVYFDEVIHGTIVNNTIINNGWSGVNVARRSDFNIVANNTIFDNSEDGIRLGEGTPSHNNTLYNNTIYNNGWDGIMVSASENNTIGSNTIYNSGGAGISLSNSSHNLISDNYVHDHPYSGISLFSCSENTISHNTAYNSYLNGIKIADADSTNNTLFSNTIYNSGASGILIYTIPINLDIFNSIFNNTCFNNSLRFGSGFPDYWTSGITVDCSSANIFNNTVFDNFDNGILILRSKNSVVSNNIIRSNGRHGISVAAANFTTIADNEVFNNANDGIHLFGSLNNSVLNNSIYNNMMTGIILSLFDGLGIYSRNDNNTLCNNTLYDNNDKGISSDDSGNTYIIRNRIHNFNNIGIHIGSGSRFTTINENTIYMPVLTRDRWGISLGGSEDNNVFDNTVFHTEFAIDVGSSNNSGITYNSIHDNINGVVSGGDTNNITIFRNFFYNNEAGIDFFSGNNITVSFNLFYNNEWGLRIGPDLLNSIISQNDLSNNLAQATDEGSTNVFYENYWSDWTGTGVYAIYTIEGSLGNQDPSPRLNPYHLSAPVILAPSTENLTLSGLVLIQWTTSMDIFGHPLTYSVLYSPNDGGSWITLTSGMITTDYTLDTTTISDGSYILLKVQAVDSLGFIAQVVSTETFFIVNSPHQLSTFHITSPKSGDMLSGSVSIEWSASFDPFGHSLNYTMYFSADDGATWTPLVSGLTTTSYSWDTTTVPNGLSYRIKVVATCSEGVTAESISEAFSVINPSSGTTSTSSDITTSMDSFILLVALVTLVISIRKLKKK